MIRFCDKDVYSINLCEVNREILFSYFLSGHRSELVCVINNFGKFHGLITYSSLLDSDNLNGAMEQYAVILDENIWEKARNFFKCRDIIDVRNADIIYLPVIDNNGYLLYFAYQDEEANKELRMLWELLDKKESKYVNYLNFNDIYPEYDCITVYGCNELAYYFIKYIDYIGMPVEVEGEIWKQIGFEKRNSVVSCNKYRIYAEGTWPKEKDMLHYIIRSVSAEFECIDKIYEANIKDGRIQDAEGDFQVLIKKLKCEKEIVLIGINNSSQDVYDLLAEFGIDIACFYSGNIKDWKHFLFGKQIMGMYQIISSLRHPVFVDCVSKYSSWSEGEVDRYVYMGYKRNEQIFLIRDYILGVPENHLRNILNNQHIVLAGNYLLCKRLISYFKYKGVGKSIYYSGCLDGKIEIKKDELCLVIEPRYYFAGIDSYNSSYQKRIEDFLERNGLLNYTLYFSSDISFLGIEINKLRYSCQELKPKSILIGAIKSYSGNYLFRDILDGHPNIVKMDYGFLNNNLFLICIMLEKIEADKVLFVFWNIYKSMVDLESQKIEFPNINLFSEKMIELLSLRKFFSSQELFVIFHIAYAAMYDEGDMKMSETIIYWEPHFVDRKICKRYPGWLNDKRVEGYTISIARNACVRAGSIFKMYSIMKTPGWGCLWNSDDLDEIEIKYDHWKNLDIKFEDIKTNPKKILTFICEQFNIRWSDNLLTTTLHGKKAVRADSVIGFDLKPVYNNYEEYFNEFDRMRISMLNYIWQKSYGYVCVDPLIFTNKELQEIFIKDFYFEKLFKYSNVESWIVSRINVKRRALLSLQRIRRVAIMEKD